MYIASCRNSELSDELSVIKGEGATTRRLGLVASPGFERNCMTSLPIPGRVSMKLRALAVLTLGAVATLWALATAVLHSRQSSIQAVEVCVGVCVREI